jgi:hypothetical protein
MGPGDAESISPVTPGASHHRDHTSRHATPHVSASAVLHTLSRNTSQENLVLSRNNSHENLGVHGLPGQKSRCIMHMPKSLIYARMRKSPPTHPYTPLTPHPSPHTPSTPHTRIVPLLLPHRIVPLLLPCFLAHFLPLLLP